MKLYSILFFLIIPQVMLAQWFSSGKRVSWLYNVSHLNHDTLFVNTQEGNFISYNGGMSFDSLGVFTYQQTVGISYRSKDTIIAAFVGSKSGLLKTTDGTKTWQYQPLLTNTGDTAFKTKSISLMYFFNASQGILVGDTFHGQYQLFTTVNSGLTWQYEQNLELQNLNLRLSSFLVSQKGFDAYTHPAGVAKLRLNEKAILTISDYGKHWQVDSIKQPDWTFRSVTFKDSLNGIASIATATVLVMAKTADGGKNWVLLSDSLKDNASASLRYVKATSRYPAFYFAFGFKGAHVSYNDGESWQRMDTLRHDQVFFKDAETAISLATRMVSEPILYYKPGFVGLQEIQPTKSVIVYPNPASNLFQFTDKLQHIMVVDIQGKQWITVAQSDQLDVSLLPQGWYILTAQTTNGNVLRQKLLIQH